MAVAVATPQINAATIESFICEGLVSNFGVPKVLISNRGTHLRNDACATSNRHLGINHHPVSAYRPHSNGQVERSIKSFKQLLRKIL
ncbi:Pol polyprotein [Smittium mucronatum]|uniref:Pol polyprotein n=1 Tax=Smittium mucronatum TaxID=133383 RepID=A0A1R0GQ68_9FUNG|nr:Pol polyprotein [Smittium mucronatum]